jgi:exopolysaccharide biosynthesis operon protein EpsL
MKMYINATELRLLDIAKNLVLLMVLTMVSTTANADPDDFFSLYVSGSYTCDSNFFRLENNQAALDRLGTTDMAASYNVIIAGANLNWQFSRQRIKAKAEINQTRFDKYSTLDFEGNDTLLQWDWVVGSALGGDAGISEKTTQGSFANIQQPINNLITQKQAFFHGDIKLGAPWKVRYGLEKNVSTNSLPSQKTLDSTVNTYKAGLQYQTSKGSLLELTSQISDGQYPNRQVVGLAPIDNGYKQWDNGVLATWEPTGKTKLQARMNYTQRRYADVPQRNYSGITGLLSANWQVTDKTGLGLVAYRNIGVVENSTASYSVNRGVALTASWNATAKVALNLSLAQSRIAYTGDPGVVLSTAPARKDQLSTLQAGVNYTVKRNISLGVALQRGVNQSNQALSSYNFNSVMFNFRAAF